VRPKTKPETATDRERIIQSLTPFVDAETLRVMIQTDSWDVLESWIDKKTGQVKKETVRRDTKVQKKHQGDFPWLKNGELGWHLEFLYWQLIDTLDDAGGTLTEDIARNDLPGRVLDIAVTCGLLPDPEPGPVFLGDFFIVTQEYFDAFLDNLPIELWDQELPWVTPTPREIFDGFLEEMKWNQIELIEQMVPKTMRGRPDLQLAKKSEAYGDTAVARGLKRILHQPRVLMTRQRPGMYHEDLARLIRQKATEKNLDKPYRNLQSIELTWRDQSDHPTE
jgi:hypothetical protein